MEIIEAKIGIIIVLKIKTIITMKTNDDTNYNNKINNGNIKYIIINKNNEYHNDIHTCNI